MRCRTAVQLGAGRSITVRRSRTDDLPSLRAFYDHLSDRSIYMRFFGTRPLLTDEQLHPSDGHDPRRRLVLIALAGGDIVGLGEYWRIPGRDAAEVAFAVADDHHHEGIATALRPRADATGTGRRSDDARRRDARRQLLDARRVRLPWSGHAPLLRRGSGQRRDRPHELGAPPMRPL